MQHGFNPSEHAVTLEQFIDYHRYVSTFIESDKMFKVFMSGVWNMDLVETTTPAIGGAPVRPAGVTPAIYGKNSREQWKYDMHRSFFGQLNATPMKQDIEEVHARKIPPRTEVTAEMPSAGVRTWVQVDKAQTVKTY